MKLEGYTCDGGCGATTVVERGDTLSRQRWFTLYGPDGWTPLYCCSVSCMSVALSENSRRQIERVR